MKTGKVTRRHTGSSYFKFYASFFFKEGQDFCAIREWCWSQWGPSCELEFWRQGKAPWAWINDQHRIRIYFETDKEYTHFLLKWS
jgi:hypothetical protein